MKDNQENEGKSIQQEIDGEKLEEAIELGSVICDEMGVCCETKGKVIHKVYGYLLGRDAGRKKV